MKANRAPAPKPEPKRRMPRFPPISEEMKEWSARLREELTTWPGVSVRPMFGMTGVYRRKKIFGALPATRALVTPNSIIFRMKPMPPALIQRAAQEPRIAKHGHPGAKWFAFEISSVHDLRDALWWLAQAYERAK